jgi:hypothetical protein
MTFRPDRYHLGGKGVYQRPEWYFPHHNRVFAPSMYENLCTGSYVGNP